MSYCFLAIYCPPRLGRFRSDFFGRLGELDSAGFIGFHDGVVVSQVIQSASLKFQVGGRAMDIEGSDLTLMWIGRWSLLRWGPVVISDVRARCGDISVKSMVEEDVGDGASALVRVAAGRLPSAVMGVEVASYD